MRRKYQYSDFRPTSHFRRRHSAAAMVLGRSVAAHRTILSRATLSCFLITYTRAWFTPPPHRRMSSLAMSSSSKEIWILRHGEAAHNPRAEQARTEQQCSHEEFLRLMQQDDCFDAPLTDLGVQQAQLVPQPGRTVELMVASPLSRALHTAELAGGAATTNRVCYEGFREINGWLYNAQRRRKSELQTLFPSWDFSHLATEEDALWTPELETTVDCRERGYQGLLWLMQRRVESSVLLVSHGALLKYTLTEHPRVLLRDGRSSTASRCIRQRYHNGEVRRYRMECLLSSNDETGESSNECATIVLTELDLV